MFARATALGELSWASVARRIEVDEPQFQPREISADQTGADMDLGGRMWETQNPRSRNQPESKDQRQPLLPIDEGDQSGRGYRHQCEPARPGVHACRAGDKRKQPRGQEYDAAEHQLVEVEGRLRSPFEHKASPWFYSSATTDMDGNDHALPTFPRLPLCSCWSSRLHPSVPDEGPNGRSLGIPYRPAWPNP